MNSLEFGNGKGSNVWKSFFQIRQSIVCHPIICVYCTIQVPVDLQTRYGFPNLCSSHADCVTPFLPPCFSTLFLLPCILCSVSPTPLFSLRSFSSAPPNHAPVTLSAFYMYVGHRRSVCCVGVPTGTTGAPQPGKAKEDNTKECSR